MVHTALSGTSERWDHRHLAHSYSYHQLQPSPEKCRALTSSMRNHRRPRVTCDERLFFPGSRIFWIWAIHKHGGMWTKGDLILRRKGPNVFRLGVWTDENVSDMISTAIKETKERRFIPQRCSKWILWNKRKRPASLSSIHPRSFIRKHKVDLDFNLKRKIPGIVWCKWRHMVVGGECLIKF